MRESVGGRDDALRKHPRDPAKPRPPARVPHGPRTLELPESHPQSYFVYIYIDMGYFISSGTLLRPQGVNGFDHCPEFTLFHFLFHDKKKHTHIQKTRLNFPPLQHQRKIYLFTSNPQILPYVRKAQLKKEKIHIYVSYVHTTSPRIRSCMIAWLHAFPQRLHIPAATSALKICHVVQPIIPLYDFQRNPFYFTNFIGFQEFSGQKTARGAPETRHF